MINNNNMYINVCVCVFLYVCWLSFLQYGETLFPDVFSQIVAPGAPARLLHCTVKATEPGRAGQTHNTWPQSFWCFLKGGAMENHHFSWENPL